MKLLTFLQDGREQPAFWIEPEPAFCRWRALAFRLRAFFRSLRPLHTSRCSCCIRATQDPARQGIELSMVKLLAPIPYFRRDMICIGYNFRNHAQEIARLRGESDKSAEVANPIYFPNAPRTRRDPTRRSPLSRGMLRIWTAAWRSQLSSAGTRLILRQRRLEIIFLATRSQTMFAIRRLNKAYTQPFLGKSVDGYMPTGPWIVTADEFAREPYFDLRLTVNGTLRQTGNHAGSGIRDPVYRQPAEPEPDAQSRDDDFHRLARKPRRRAPGQALYSSGRRHSLRRSRALAR